MNKSTPENTPTQDSAALMTQDFQQSSDDQPSKQLRDVAFAAALLESGRISERQLQRAIRDWSAFGERSLAEHLADAGLIDAADEKRLGMLVEESLKKTVGPGLHATPNDVGVTTGWGPEGGDDLIRTAKLLGLGHANDAEKNTGGRQVNTQYTLLRKLGQGGLGSVWLARDESLNRKVAIKEITQRPNLPPAALNRFRREAEITGQLEHPNIVSVYQFGDDAETGQSFYAMRFLGKKTLADAVTEYHERQEAGIDVTMELHHLLTAFLSVCQAIGFAHSKEIIHRDLKPENIALDCYGQVIVIDWGLAKVVGDGEFFDAITDAGGDADPVQQTVAGQVLGTPLYMAPEQAAGRIDEIDERTDIYGLGAILFSILSGYAPHEKSHASLSSNTKVSELITAIVSEDSPRVRQLNANVDPALAAVCAKAMAKRRYARYESASELAEDVQRWQAGERVSAYDEPWTKRLQRWIQHHRLLSQILAGCLIVVFVVGVTLAIMARQNHMAALHTQFEEMRSHGRQLEAQLVAESDDLGKQVRFMSTLPPIQGIINARDGEKEAESEVVWRGRLEKIYRGLLRAHGDYLSVSYIGLDNDQSAKEIVRVERHSSDAAEVRAVPASRLAVVECKGLLDETMQLPPGELNWSFQSISTERVKVWHGRILSALAPVYKENNGEPFGVVAIEMNLTHVARSLLAGLKERNSEIFLTDASGKIWMRSLPDFGIERVSDDLSIADVASEAKSLFSNLKAQRILTDRRRFYATIIRLNPDDATTNMGLVLQLADD